MTVGEVERGTRTAYPTTVAPVGARMPMPPHSQGAERRTRRTRWGLRALVVGGLAGAAWLLTGTAAQAADHDATPGFLPGPSLISAVVDGDTTPPAVGKVRTVAARPLDRDRPAVERPVASVEVLTETLDDVTTDAISTPGAVDRVVRETSGPLRLTGGPADSPLAPVPATTGERPSARSVPHPAAVTATVQDEVRYDRPAGNGPAPLQVHLGAGGISTAASGAPAEGGSAAYLPATVAGDPVTHRSPAATDAGVRRHDAVAPTVPPD